MIVLVVTIIVVVVVVVNEVFRVVVISDVTVVDLVVVWRQRYDPRRFKQEFSK